MKTLLRSVAPFVLLLLPALGWSQTYNLPSSVPSGCTAAGSVVTCSGWRTFGSGVVITVESDASPVTLNMTGGGSIAGAQINVVGNPADLTINVTGNNLNLSGSNTRIVANLSALDIHGSGASNARLTGNLSVSGQLQLGSNAQVIGDVTANTFSTGTGSVISGDVNLQGSFSPSSYTEVHGSVTATSIQASGASNLSIQGDLNLSGQLRLGSQSQITGNVVAGSMETGQNNTIIGDVSVVGTLGLGQGSTINGNASGSLINIFNQASVTGAVQSSGNVNLSQGAAVGPVTAGGSLSAGTNVVIDGSIDVGGQVTLGEYSVVHGGIQAETQVSIHDDVVIHGSIATNGQVTVNEDVTVYGGVTAGTNIQIHNRSHIHGDLVGHDIHIFLDAMIEGSVEAQGVVTNAGVIQGNINAQGNVWLNGSGLCLVEVDGRLEPQLPGSGGTQGCVSGYVNAPNDHLIPPENVGGLICDQNVNIGPCAGSGGGPLVTMYRIINPGTALTCEPLELQVFACADPNCQTGLPVTGDVSVQATPVSGPGVQGTGNFDDDSVAAVNLSITETGAYTLSLLAVPEEAADPFQCAGPQGCSVTAVDALLRWSEVPHQTAGLEFSLQVEAIRTDTETTACVAALQGQQSLSVSLDCDDPGSCSSDGLQFSTLAGSQLTEWPVTSTRAVTFDGDGRAQLGEMVYEDAGRIRLQAAVTAGDASISGWSNPFVVRPATVGVEVINIETYSNPEIFARAGDDLTVTLSALSATGRVTRNFGGESSPESLELLPPMALTTFNGVDGVITGQLQWIQDGQYSGVVRYSEAGPVRFTAWIASDNYLGSGAGASGYEDLGRFLPWEFRVEKVGSSAQMVCTDSAPGFTYLGEPFDVKLRVSALNGDGGITRNYPDVGDGAIAKLVARDIDTSTNLTDRLEQYEPQEPSVRPAPPLYLSINWGPAGDLITGGEGTLPADTQIKIKREPFDVTDPADAGPYELVTIGVEIDDNETGGPFVPLADNTDFSDLSDDCTADGNCAAVSLVEDARFVYGRMVLTDTFGSEFSNLPVTLQVHYWDGERFRLHQADQCTDIDEAGFSIIASSPEGLDTSVEGVADNVTLLNGSAPPGSLWLTAPNEPGEVTFEYTAPDWLKFGAVPGSEEDEASPTATATFGTYGGHDRVIHWRLVH